jgi:spore photoproduct lyase
VFNFIYVEKGIEDHPRTRQILSQFPKSAIVTCEHYGEIFNRHQQDFRMQKKQPCLILAEKHNKRILPAPPEYGLDTYGNYYFSHMLNCIYDCRYCFLQGMFQSAHNVIFVNYEDFILDMVALTREAKGPIWFYSGYDCDSLALDPITGFSKSFIETVSRLDNTFLELRTKSTQIRKLLEISPRANVICAFSLSPEEIIKSLEHQAPSLNARLSAAKKLQLAGWPVALRLDPIILIKDFKAHYECFFEQITEKLDLKTLHSITIGAFRLPKRFFKTVKNLYPEEPLFADEFSSDNGQVSYEKSTEQKLLDWCEEKLKNYKDCPPVYRQALK